MTNQQTQKMKNLEKLIGKISVYASFIFLFLGFIQLLSAQELHDGIKVEKIGNGNKNIILLPGFGSSGDVWNKTIDALGKDYTFFKLTFPGFAGVPAEEDPNYNAWTKAVIGLIKKSKIENPTLIGHSMGGLMALTIAAEEPKLVQKIVVVDAVPCLMALSNPAFKADPNTDCSAMVAQINAMSADQFKNMQTQAVKTLVRDTVHQNLVLDWTLKSDRNTFGKMYCNFSQIDLRDSLTTITAPALILMNSGFKTIGSSIDEQYRGLTNKSIRYADNSLHFIMYDAEDWYLEQLKSFL